MELTIPSIENSAKFVTLNIWMDSNEGGCKSMVMTLDNMLGLESFLFTRGNQEGVRGKCKKEGMKYKGVETDDNPEVDCEELALKEAKDSASSERAGISG